MHVPSPRAASLAAALALAAAVAALFAWAMTVGFTTPEPFQDYRFHNELAVEMAGGAPLEVPHPLYHALVAALAAGGLSPPWSGMAVALAAQVALALIVFADLRVAARGAVVRAAVTAAGLTVVAPLNWLTPASREFYFGYLFPNAIHNPTIVLLRPLSVALFVCVVALFTAEAEAGRGRIAGAAALTIACALAKPSFVICLLPALGVAWLLEGRPLDRRWRTVILGVMVPGGLVAAAQAAFTLTTDRMEPATIVLAPLKAVFMHTKDDAALVAAKLALSIVFPLAVAAAFFGDARRDRALRLAWLAFAAGAFYAYFLAEAGPRMIHGNFLWSGQAAAAVLFAASARFALARGAAGAARARLGLCAAALALHVASGLQYLVHFARTAVAF
jgi:hypothetical protein